MSYPTRAIVALLATLAAPAALACGPFFEDTYYNWDFRPTEPWLEAIQNPGLPDPGWWSTFQVMSWRQIQGRPIQGDEAREFAAAWDRLLAPPSEDSAADRWVKARQGWPDPPARGYLRVHRDIPDTYQSYENCLPDAFATAIEVATQRHQSLSADDFRAWLLAQDQVFAACADPEAPEPAALPKEADPTLRQDRAYQQAAWSFYQGRYPEAEARYASIAASRSPWAPRAKLMLARVALRQNSLQGADTLASADARLDAVLSDRRGEPLHASARRLKRLVTQRREGSVAALDRIGELVDQGRGTAEDIVDLSVLLDRYMTGVLEYDEQGELAINPIYRIRSESIMVQWIIAYHWGDPADDLSRGDDPIWLMPRAKGHPMRDQQALSAIEDIQSLPDGHPVKIALSLQLIQRDISTAEFDRARDRIDQLLAANPPQSTKMRLLRERVQVAESLGKLLELAWQRPLAYGFLERAYEHVPDPSLGLALLPEAADILNSQLPTSVLQLLPEHPLTPPAYRAPLQRSVLARAVVLGDDAALSAAVAGLARLDPEAAWLQKEVSAAPDAAARRAAGALYVLRHPGVSWEIAPDYGRDMPIGEIDDYRRNWWSGNVGNALPTSFLTSVDFQKAHDEHKTLNAAGPAGDALGAFLLPWLRANPQAPAAAELLHHIVRATRYTVEGQGKTSQAAFALLHRAYPSSEWAAKTPYWFK